MNRSEAVIFDLDGTLVDSIEDIDSAVNMEIARNAGTARAGALWGYRGAEELLEAGAETLVAHPLAVLDLLRA